MAGAEHEAIRGMNYVELGGLIDHLATHIDGGAGGDNSMYVCYKPKELMCTFYKSYTLESGNHC